MNALKNVLTFLYYLGIASCGIQGADKPDACAGYFMPRSVCSSIVCSFGGGYIRDVALLGVPPVVFTLECVPDIEVSVIGALLWVLLSAKGANNRCWVSGYTSLTDAIGLGTFIVIGVDKALTLEKGPSIAFLSGVATSIGGGITSTLIFERKSFGDMLRSSVLYRIVDITCTGMYVYWRYTGVEATQAQLILVITTTVLALLSNDNVGAKVKNQFLQVLVLDCSTNKYNALLMQQIVWESSLNLIYLPLCVAYGNKLGKYFTSKYMRISQHIIGYDVASQAV